MGNAKIKVHVVGTHGIPGKYGGFETLADFLCQNLTDEFDITVYCYSKLYPERPKMYKGVRLKYLKIFPSGFMGIFYDLFTFVQALFSAKIILFLGPVGSGSITPIRYLFPGRKVIINHGGLNEWEREKLSWIQKKWAKFNHYVAGKASSINVVDNSLYQKSLKTCFGVDSTVIRYGGDHVIRPEITEELLLKYPYLKDKYAVSVSRAQVDNNLHVVLEAFEKDIDFKLVLIANWNVSDYGKQLFQKYQNHPNIITQMAVYDKEELDAIRSSAYYYIHSHSRCGTAPSLVEAICLGLPIISFDVPTNRETTENKAVFFHDVSSLKEKIISLTDEKRLDIMKEIIQISGKYTWKEISNHYKQVISSFK
jgi:glycosyltransferase involved in cell wall biosynthesis